MEGERDGELVRGLLRSTSGVRLQIRGRVRGRRGRERERIRIVGRVSGGMAENRSLRSGYSSGCEGSKDLRMMRRRGIRCMVTLKESGLIRGGS